jgi:hypothetical protein
MRALWSAIKQRDVALARRTASARAAPGQDFDAARGELGRTENQIGGKGKMPATTQTVITDKHQAAILDAEARRVAHTLTSYGVLTRRQLEELSGARFWNRGRFSLALELAQERGLIRHLGYGFYASVTHNDAATRPPSKQRAWRGEPCA